jgi:hypothetical protein
MEEQAIYMTQDEPKIPWHCPDCGAVLGYILKRTTTINRLERKLKVLRRLNGCGKNGDVIIGDADIVCTCGSVIRWDYTRAWGRK